MSIGLSVNSHEMTVASVAELRTALGSFAAERFRDIWLSVEGGPALCALMNGGRGWLMYLRHQDGDAGLSSRNPAFAGSASSMIEYYLSNGQRDEYPAAWALPEEEIMRALEYFVEHGGGRAPFVHWHDDGDG